MSNLIIMSIYGCFCGYISKKNGINFWIGFAIGFVLGILGIPVVYLIKNKSKENKHINVEVDKVSIEKNEENALNESVQEYTNDSPIKDTKSNPIFDLISIILILFVVGLSIYSLKYSIDQRPKAVDYDIDSNSTAIPFNSVVE